MDFGHGLFSLDDQYSLSMEDDHPLTTNEEAESQESCIDDQHQSINTTGIHGREQHNTTQAITSTHENIRTPSASENYETNQEETNQGFEENHGANTDQVPPEEETETLRKNLRFYFYNSIKYHHDHHNHNGRRCSVHTFHFCVMLLQIVEIICITVLMCHFGQERGYFNNIVKRGQLTMKNLLLKDWSADWETPPYPPSRGEFAVYDYKALQDKINYAVTSFYNLMEDSIGFYRPLKKDSVRVEMKYVSFNGSHDEKAVHGIFVETNTFMVHVRNYTDKATNKTRYVYDVLDDLKRNNLTEAMKRLLCMTLSFTTESVRVFTDEANALCLTINGQIVFADHKKNGQMTVQLETTTTRIACKELGYDVSDKTGYSYVRKMAIAVLVFSSLSAVFTCVRVISGLYVCCLSCKYRKRYRLPCFEPDYCQERLRRHVSSRASEEPANTDDKLRQCLSICSSIWVYMKFFFKLWDFILFAADVVVIMGCADILGKETESGAAWTVASLESSIVLLGCGCLIGWFALLRYFKFNYKFHILFNTIYASIWDVLAYLLCVTVLFLGYMFFGYAVFGPYHIKFETLRSSAETLLSLVNGDEIYATFALIEKDQTGSEDRIPVIFRIYTGSYIAIFTIIVLNLLIALFTNAYDSIKKHYQNVDSEEDGPLLAALKKLLLSEDTKDKQLQKVFLDLMKKDQKTLSRKQATLKKQMERAVMLSKSEDQFISVEPKTVKEFINDNQAHGACCELVCWCFCIEKKLITCPK